MDISLYKNRTVECGELIETEKNEFLFCKDGRIKAREFIELEDKKENLVSLIVPDEPTSSGLYCESADNNGILLSTVSPLTELTEVEIQDTNKIIYSKLYDTFDFIITENKDSAESFLQNGNELQITIRNADDTGMIEEITLNENTPSVKSKTIIPAKLSITMTLKIAKDMELFTVVYPQIYKNNVNIQLAKGYKIKALNFKEVTE